MTSQTTHEKQNKRNKHKHRQLTKNKTHEQVLETNNKQLTKITKNVTRNLQITDIKHRQK